MSDVPGLGGTIRTFSGTFGSVEDSFVERLLGKPQPRSIEIAPKGMRWPWLPLFVGRGTFGTPSRWWSGETPVGCTWTEGPVRERVGWRRSFRYWFKERP